PERERRAVGLGREEGDRRVAQLETVHLQEEGAHDFVLEQAGGLGAGVYAVAGEDGFRRRGAAEHVTRFKHGYAQAAAREHRRRGQPVVARPNHQYVDLLGHSQLSLRISSAASLPGAPMIPPPGWVPEPHW